MKRYIHTIEFKEKEEKKRMKLRKSFRLASNESIKKK